MKIEKTNLRDHAVLIGHGRVGARIAAARDRRDLPKYVIEENDEIVNQLANNQVEAVSGNGVALLKFAKLQEAKCLLMTIPDSFEAGQIVAQTGASNAALPIVARGIPTPRLTISWPAAPPASSTARKIANAMAGRIP